MKKNEEYTIDITGIGNDGEGVGRIDNMAVFVPYALLGEKVKVIIVKVLKNYAFAKIIDIINPSVNRVSPQCEVFYQCGGCNIQHADYKYELEFKTNKVKDCIKRIGGFDIEVLPCEASPDVLRYRNKCQYAVTNDGIGFFSARSHRLVSCKTCLIQNIIAEKISFALSEYMKLYNVKPYDEINHSGTIRNLFIRTVKYGVMVCVVTNSADLPNKDKLVELLVNAGATSIILNINSKRTNVALGETNICLYGKMTVIDEIDNIKFEISPHSFYQINSMQTTKLYNYALNLAELNGTQTVFDLYCGIGTISLFASRNAKIVKGVEIVKSAVDNAKQNARINKISNVEFYCGKAEELADSLGNADVVIVDPPRKGCDDKLLNAINIISPEKIIYISCNPSTLARDMKILSNFNYVPNVVKPFDMFPRTAHVETIVSLQRRDM